jgi:hypothetical protein
MDWAPGEQTEGGSEGAWGRRVTARAGSSAGGDGPHLGTRDERLGEQGGWSSAMGTGAGRRADGSRSAAGGRTRRAARRGKGLRWCSTPWPSWSQGVARRGIPGEPPWQEEEAAGRCARGSQGAGRRTRAGRARGEEKPRGREKGRAERRAGTRREREPRARREISWARPTEERRQAAKETKRCPRLRAGG